ncbi:hypothetical protein PMAYCL1PPCAC_24880, partial [Pristionchus mayeri]
WESIIDEQKGFVKDDKVTIEIRFWIYNMIGIRTTSPIDFSDPNEPFHNVALVIGEEKVYVSKEILAVHSPVFKAMFFGDFAEKNKKEFELKDVEREEFIDVLHLIYNSGKKITDANAGYLLKLADRFQILTIVDKIEHFFIDLTNDSVAEKLWIADQYNLVHLQ